MNAASPEAIEAGRRIIIGASLKELGEFGSGNPAKTQAANVIQAALPIERTRWEAEVRERLDVLIAECRRTPAPGAYIQILEKIPAVIFEKGEQ